MLARVQKDNGSRKRRASKLDIAIGNHIRLRRLEKRMSQDALAQGCDVAFQQIQKYESGVDRLSVSRFVKIAKTLDIEPRALLTESLAS